MRDGKLEGAKMAIVGDLIEGVERITLHHKGLAQTPALLVVHYSVTNTVAEAVAALNARKLSYHILIEKDGTAFQTRPFTETAAHPGLSNWKATSGVDLGSSVSKGSIGICLMNKGFGFDPSLHESLIGAGQLIYNPDDQSMQRWEKFPAAQIASCTSIAKDIIATYPITDVVGHQDIAIMGKFDPGPLFDLAALNALIASVKPLGFPTTIRPSSDGFFNLRRGPSSTAAVVRPLPTGTRLHIRSIAYGSRANCIDPASLKRARYLTPWASVDLDGSDRHAGFVHMSGLSQTPLVPSLAAKL